jgi:hypothetical protein
MITENVVDSFKLQAGGTAPSSEIGNCDCGTGNNSEHTLPHSRELLPNTTNAAVKQLPMDGNYQ